MREIDDSLLNDFKSSQDIVKLYLKDNTLWLFAAFKDISAEEMELLREQDFHWKTVRIAKTSYFCFSPTGYSWNEIALQNSLKSQNLEELIGYQIGTLPIRFVGVREDTQDVFTDRDFVLDELQTGKLKAVVKNQEYITQKEIDDLNFLGDPTPLLRAMQNTEMPDILGVEVNREAHKVEFKVNMMPKREFKEPRARWILRHFENISGYDKLRTYSALLETMAEERIEREWKHCLLPADVFQELDRVAEESEVRRQLKNLGYEHLIEEELEKLPDNYYFAVYSAVLFNWRYSKGIYNFDDDVLKSVYLASLPVHIKGNIFTRLPEYCIYAKTPGMTDWNGNPMQGFFAMTEKVPVDEELAEFINGHYEDQEDLEPLETDSNLYLLIDGGSTDESSDGRTNIVKMPIDFETLEECLELIELIEPRPDEREPTTEELIEWAVPFLSQLLYLCSEEPEIENSRDRELKPETEDVKKTKKGLRLYVPSRINEWLCGWRTGSFIKRQKVLENAENELNRVNETTKSVRGHLRRAHWHTFYAGKRTAAKREIRVKWLQMIKVNFESQETDKLPTVIKRVE